MRPFITARYLLLAVTVAAVGTLGLAQSQPTVVTTDGPVAGFQRDGVTQFRGIPYAAPPVGNLRWRPPQPHAKWTATLDAVSFGDKKIGTQATRYQHRRGLSCRARRDRNPGAQLRGFQFADPRKRCAILCDLHDRCHGAASWTVSPRTS